MPEPRRSPRWHVAIVVLLYLAVIPVALKDHGQGGGGGGDWITLDLRGVYVALYAVIAAVLSAIVLLHLFWPRLRSSQGFPVVVACLAGPALASFAAVQAYLAISEGVTEQRKVAERAEDETLGAAMRRDVRVRWTVAPDPLPSLDVEILSRRPVQVSYVHFQAEDADGRLVASGRSGEVHELRPGVAAHATLPFGNQDTPTKAVHWKIYVQFELSERKLTVSWTQPDAPGAP